MADDAPSVLLRGEDSGGQVAVVYRGGGRRPPLHKHDFDETFYVIEGEITFQLDGELVTRCAGEVAVAPRGVPHTYANLSGAPARMLLVITPGGFRALLRVHRLQAQGHRATRMGLASNPGGHHARAADRRRGVTLRDGGSRTQTRTDPGTETQVSAALVNASMSLDGFIDGPDEGPVNGLGYGGHRLHEWEMIELERTRVLEGMRVDPRAPPHRALSRPRA